MELSLKADRLKEITDIVSSVVTETLVVIDEDEFKVRAVDEANIAMVDISLLSKGFEEYNVEEKDIIGLNLERVQQFLRIVDSDDLLELSKEKGKLRMKRDNLTQSIPLLDTENIQDPDIPDLDLPTEVKTKAEYIQTGVKAANNISDQVKVEVDEMKFSIEAEGKEDEIDLTVYADQFGKYEVEEEIESLFALDYLKDMVSSVSSKAPIYLRLGSDHPMEIEYNFAEGYGKALMMLAPRIEK